MNTEKISALLRMGLAGVAAAFAGGALAVGAARYLPQDSGCYPLSQPQPVQASPAPRHSGPGLFV